MYETFFGLKRRPFLAVPDTDSYFSVEIMEEARRTIQRTVRRGEGISLIFGPAGTGKTLLLRLLRQALEVDHAVSLISNGHLESPKAFLQQLLFDLRLPFSGGEAAELRLQLLDFVRQEATPGLALLVDESQFLDTSVLEEIRVLMNCDDGAAPFFRAVLAGTPEFEEKLTHPHLEAFNQRIVTRSYLETFSREDTYRYIEWQSNLSRDKTPPLPEPTSEDGEDGEARDSALGLAEFIRNSGSSKGHRVDSPHVKGTEPIFTMSARRQIHQLTGGTPRLINQLCDTSLQLAAERLLRQVDEVLVHSAWARLQQFDEDGETSSTADEAENAAMNVENIDEIIARKKATFQPKLFDSTVQFGTLDGEVVEANTEASAETDSETDIDETVDEVPDMEPVSVDPDSWAYDEQSEPDCNDLDGTEDSTTETEDPTEAADEAEVFDETETADSPEPTDEIVDDVSVPCPVRRSLLRPVRQERTFANVMQKYLFRRRGTNSLEPGDGLSLRLPFFLTLRRFDALDSWIGHNSLRPLFVPVRLFTLPVVEIDNFVEETPPPEMEPGSTEPEWDDALETPLEEDRTTEEMSDLCDTEKSDIEEGSMDLETLEKYGTEVLDGRPPFVRKEPNYAYQTTDRAVEQEIKNLPEYPYSDPSTGNTIMLRWVLPELRNDIGFGTAYRLFLERNAFEEETEMAVETVAEAVAEESRETELVPFLENSVAEEFVPVLSSVLKVNLEESLEKPKDDSPHTALDESFDEIIAVLKKVVALDELYYSGLVSAASARSGAEDARSGWNEPIFQRQLDTVLRRLTEAADKIEQAADHSSAAAGKIDRAAEVSEDAGRHVRHVANFVEAEVKSVLPTYLDLFQELSEFQKTITEELTFMQEFQRLSRPNGDFVEASASNVPEGNQKRSAKLLPFPRRPDFASIDPTSSGAEATGRLSRSKYPTDSGDSATENDEGEPKDDQSIDVRTLFQ